MVSLTRWNVKRIPFFFPQIHKHQLRSRCSDIESVGIKLRYRARTSIFPPTFARYRRIFAWPTSSYRVLLVGGLCRTRSDNLCPSLSHSTADVAISSSTPCHWKCSRSSAERSCILCCCCAGCTRHAKRLPRDYYWVPRSHDGSIALCAFSQGLRLKVWIFTVG